MSRIALAWIGLTLIAADWPQWRGPTRDGQVAGSDWPENLDNLKQLWKVPLGPSYSGPIIAGDRVFVTESKDQTTEVVRALDRKTGQELWKAEWPGSVKVVFIGKPNGDWIKATPAFDGGDLFVAGMRDTLACLDATNGNIRWQVDFIKEFNAAVPPFGNVSSPLVDGDAVYTQAAGSVLKLNRKTGAVIWRALAGSNAARDNPFSSPIIATMAGTRQLIVQSRKVIAGLDLETGKELWSAPVKAFQDTNVLTPLVVGDRVFTGSYGGGSVMFEVKKSDEGFAIEPVWRSKQDGYMSSPVLVNGHIYLFTRTQRFVCLEAATGKEAWVSQPFGKYWSVVAQGSKILAQDERGDLLLMKADPSEFQLLGKKHVSDATTWAHVAAVDGVIYVRELDALTVYEWK